MVVIVPNKMLYALDKYIPVYGRDRVLVARSIDGKVWERSVSPAINVGHDCKFDMAYWPFVWREGSLWKMVFSGSPNLRQPKRVFSLYTSTSADLINWTEPEDLLVDDGYYMCPRVYHRAGEAQLLWSSGDNCKEVRTSCLSEAMVPGELVTIKSKTGLVDCVDFNICGDILAGVTSSEAGNFIFARERVANDWDVFAETAVKMAGYDFINNPSLVQLGSEWLLFYRASKRTAWGSELWCIKSGDLETWSEPELALDYSGWKRKSLDGKSYSVFERVANYELGGVGYPTVIEAEGILYAFYGGYWGLHLLMPYTYWFWR
ncbi:hypothetical protein [Maridesulfovibrio sp. FT414]|uniref:hypothetical protein n=1 Tax=Maridesulfovibrio sp. FT414 TaxID=2979469 RepID=UPI003D805AD2